MRSYSFLLLLFFATAVSAFGQQPKQGPGSISGSIIDAGTAESLPYVSIVLLNADSALVAGAMANEQGTFLLDGLPLGTFRLQLQLMGYSTQQQRLTLSRTEKKLALGEIRLEEDTKLLEEVVVEGEQASLSLKLDKKVFHPDQDVLSQSGSASDVLDRIPSVSVAPDGSISFRGNSQVLILINGRRSGLSLTNALEQIPADHIERVEVISNPSARYDAAGSAGIINLVLKKNKAEGLNGQIRLVGGIPDDFRINGSLNYKTGRLNLFATGGYRYTDYEGEYSSKQTTYEAAKPVFLRMNQDEDRHDDGRQLYLGADYALSEKSSITAAFFRYLTADTDQTRLTYRFGQEPQPDSLLERRGNSSENRSYNQLEFNFSHQFEKEKQKLSLDAQYEFWDSEKVWDLATQSLFPTEEEGNKIRSISVGASNDLAVQADYMHPFTKNTQLEVGLKAENRRVKSDYVAEEQQEGAWETYLGIDNELEYEEQIGSAYIQLGTQWNKLSLLLGLRNEFTEVRTNDVENSFQNNQRYNRLFPSANLQYSIKETSSLRLSYSRRINRPSLFFIYPFYEVTDFNAQFMGNPELNPAFTDALELGMLMHGSKLSFNPSVYYQNTRGGLLFYVYRDDRQVFVTRPINLDEEQRYGIDISTVYEPLAWLQLSHELNYYVFSQRGEMEETILDYNDHSWSSSLTSAFTLPAKVQLQVQYQYQGPQSTAQTWQKSRSSVDFGISKGLWKERASLVFDVSNLLNTNQRLTISRGQGFVLEQMSNRNAARYRLSFVYRFNQSEKSRNRRQQRSNRH